jgi:catechol 2,3-dioxygenase-like lactoylglutathione lyase family enzyme
MKNAARALYQWLRNFQLLLSRLLRRRRRAPRLHHLALGAQDVGALAEFYREVLGMAEVARHAEPGDGSLRSVWLDLGDGAVLMIEKTDQPLREPVVGHDSGIFLLALTADEKTVEKRCKGLAESGIRLERATDFSRYFRDPEGNSFAFSVYPLPG